MGRIFSPARVPGGGAASPDVKSMFYTTGQTFKRGAIVVPDAATGRIIESGADPASVIGIALEDAGSKPGNNLNFDSLVQTRTGVVQEVSVAMANRQTIFSGRMVNGGTDPVTPVQADIDKKYGVLKTGGGEWVVDQTETTNLVLVIVDADFDNKIVLWKFLEAVLVLTA